MLRYLKNTGSNTADSNQTIITLPSFANVVTISNTTSSINSVTGALVVAGGVGIDENLNVTGTIATLGDIEAVNGRFSNNLTVQGYTTSSYVTVPGILTATRGDFVYLYGNTLNISGETITNTLEVINNANFGSINSLTATIDAITADTISGLSEITTDTATAINLYVDNIYPNSGTQVNLGDIEKLRIIGGSNNQVLGTDGNGNLKWLQGTDAISVGTGLRRDGDVISLSGTGFSAGTFNQVTIDEFGRVVSATNFVNDLQNVTARNATTDVAINITNTTESNDTTEGALTVAGGVGVSGTITAQDLVVKSTATIEGPLLAQDQITANGTVNFNANQIPLKLTNGTLVTSPGVGSIEFDGDSLYVTTNVGRQRVQLKQSNITGIVTFVARAIAARNINIASATQYTVDGDDNWDDVILELSDVVLLTKQNNPVENGLYFWNTENSPLTRYPDFNAITGVSQGTVIFISEGIENRGSFYKITTPNPIAVGTTSLTIEEQFNADNIALSSLPKDSTAGLVVRTKYGAIALRQVQSNASWITITNPAGYDGNITINTTTVPVSSGGTGRSSITGWMKGVGGTIQSTPTVPLAEISGAGTMASQNANNVSIIGGTIDSVIIGNTIPASSNFTDVTIKTPDRYSVYFDGTGDYLSISNPPASVANWDVDAFTIEMWIYVSSIPVECTVYGNLIPNSTWYWGLNITTNKALKFFSKNTAGNSNAITSGSNVINLNQWHHISYVKDSSASAVFSNAVRNIYVDGVKVVSTGDVDGSNSGIFSGAVPITIGVNYNGYITNLRVISGTALYIAPYTAPTTSLTALSGTSLLTCQDSTFKDNSTNALTITANGDAQIAELSPFDIGISFKDLILNDYLTGLFRVKGDSSLNGTLQVSGPIYEEGSAVLNENDIIDGGTY